MKYRVIKGYHDSQEKRVLSVGEEIEVSNADRVTLLTSKGLVEPLKVNEPLGDDVQVEKPKKRGRKPKS